MKTTSKNNMQTWIDIIACTDVCDSGLETQPVYNYREYASKLQQIRHFTVTIIGILSYDETKLQVAQIVTLIYNINI